MEVDAKNMSLDDLIKKDKAFKGNTPGGGGKSARDRRR